jgi:hypothetical protein
MITLTPELMLEILNYLETKPAKEVFILLTKLSQTVAPQFQALQAAQQANEPAPEVVDVSEPITP